ncbi:hypothetical protein PVK06_020254 [Gossypium arboreum]|uniref:Uncharacterized protein n=1 Tax=Gossypium arboreum TaxID=29729 RepID=A0ABR0PLX2_GOSAR|nr:hypothetical protein PVK06_020254 [Gossypium arboreum]
MLQKNASFSISSNIELKPKREGKEHARVITLRFEVVIKELVRPIIREGSEKENSTYTPRVGDG